MTKARSVHTWGAYLARLRQDAALSGGEVVTRLASLGVTADRRSIYAYEAGRIAAPDAGVVWGMAKIYGISADELIAKLVLSRTSHKLPSIEGGTSTHTTIRVTPHERDLIQRIRRLSARTRQTCAEFVAFEAERGTSKRRRRDSTE